MELAGQIAIVTGAGRGIGRATALELARLGADIVIAEMDQVGAKRTAEEVGALGRRAVATSTDVTSRADLRAMVDRTKAEFGSIDILVNNAGIYRAAATVDVTEEHWDAIMNINAKAVFFASQAVIPTMAAQKSGSIVSLASMAGKIGSKTNLPYNASKAAVVSMTKSLALAHAAEGIRVNCVCPGFVETDMWAQVSKEQGALLGMSAEEFTRHRAAQVPLGRMEKPEDVAHVIAFLAGPRSGYMTGQALSVDGGLVMHEGRSLKKAHLHHLSTALGQAHPDRARDYGLAAIDRSLVGITKTTCLHLCFGYAFAAARAGIQKPSGYSFLPELDLSLLDGLPLKTVVLGVLDLGDPAAESPDTVARRIEAALARRPASGLVAAPDCGMKHLPRATAFAKLRSLAEGARLAGGD